MEVFKNNTKYTDVQIKELIELLTKVYQKAIEDSGGFSYFYINLAKMYQMASMSARLDYLDQSLTLLNEALVKTPNRIDIYYAMAQGYFMKDDIKSAEDSLNRALALGVRQSEVYYRFAEIQVRKGDPQQAILNINQSEKYGREWTFVELENYAKLFIERKEWSAATKIFIKIDGLKPNNVDTYANIALSYSKAGDKKKAIEWANKILALDPSRTKEVQEFISSLR